MKTRPIAVVSRAHRRKRRLGSCSTRCTHSSPSRCTRCGVRVAFSTTKSSVRPIPIRTGVVGDDDHGNLPLRPSPGPSLNGSPCSVTPSRRQAVPRRDRWCEPNRVERGTSPLHRVLRVRECPFHSMPIDLMKRVALALRKDCLVDVGRRSDEVAPSEVKACEGIAPRASRLDHPRARGRISTVQPGSIARA